MSWELDFWGKYRRATEAARADLAAPSGDSAPSSRASSARWRRSTSCCARSTCSSRSPRVRWRRAKSRCGSPRSASAAARRRSWTCGRPSNWCSGRAAQIADVSGRTEQVENALSVLLARAPGPIARGQALDRAAAGRRRCRPGLPSTLLERRPDIQQAEQQLVAANARIGVAEAASVPADRADRIGRRREHVARGSASPSGDLVASAPTSCSRSSTPAATARVALAEAQAQESDARLAAAVLAGAARGLGCAGRLPPHSAKCATTQEALVVAATDSRRLADLRYRGGATSYLEVLDSDTRLYIAELGLVQAQLAELTAYVEVYRALGGGWKS